MLCEGLGRGVPDRSWVFSWDVVSVEMSGI